MSEIKRYNEIIIEGMKAKGISIEELAEETGIVAEYIKALIDRNFDKLPALPYVRGYLLAISEKLGLDFDELWNEFTNEEGVKKSGEKDILPQNRFEQKSFMKRPAFMVTIIGLGVIAIFTLIFYSGTPKLEIIDPQSDEIMVKSHSYVIIGKVDDTNAKVTINGDEAIADNEGFFKKEVYLDNGINVFNITAKRVLGRAANVKRVIIKEKEEPKNLINNFEEVDNTNNSSSSSSE